MKLNVFVVMIFIAGLFVTPLTLSAANPAQMELDTHMKTVNVHLKNKEYKAAAEIFSETDKLIAEHHLKAPRGYYYFKADVMFQTNQLAAAQKSIEQYLMLTGRTGCHYEKAMQLFTVLEQTPGKK